MPVTRTDRSRAMLKLTFPNESTDHESDVLAAWNGNGAVRLLERDDLAHARLLERLGNPSLFQHTDTDHALAVAGDLAKRLAVAPPAGLPRITDFAESWTSDLLRLARTAAGRRVSAAAVDMAVATCRELGPDQPDTLLHGDLHGRNILSATRADWLVIDPLGMTGEVALECLTPIRDHWTRLQQGTSPAKTLLHQIHVFADAAEIIPERAVAWVQMRATRAALRGIKDDHGLHLWVAETLTREKHPFQ